MRENTDFRKLKWQARPRLAEYPSKRWGHSTVVHDGRLVIYGGNFASRGKEGLHTINCESLEGDCLSFGTYPELRESHSCNVIKDSLYVFGGCINQEVHLFNSALQSLFVFCLFLPSSRTT